MNFVLIGPLSDVRSIWLICTRGKICWIFHFWGRIGEIRPECAGSEPIPIGGEFPPSMFSFGPLFLGLKTDRGPSLGSWGPNSMVSSNLPSVWSGRTGLVSYGLGLEIRVWTRNSWLRVARTNLTANSDSTSNFGLYGIFPGMFWYFCVELWALIFLHRTRHCRVLQALFKKCCVCCKYMMNDL